MTKILNFLKFWGNDYTISIYILKILGASLTMMYYCLTLFDKKKTKLFNRKKNFFVLERLRQIDAWNGPANDEFTKKFLQGGRYNFNGIYFPVISNTTLMRSVYDDSLKIYTEYNDNYSYTIVDKLEKTLPEGTYCYVGKNGEDITVKQGSVVVDAGAWIGDFSAYAAKKGAHVYSFEPSPGNITMLKKTIQYNNMEKDITIVPYGLGEEEAVVPFSENEDDFNSGASTFRVKASDASTTIAITTLDIWAQKNNISKIDFLKSDIEGYERHMLRGATKILKEHQPVLSICTYHLPDDREVLKQIILDANPNYKIIQRKLKLFAYVK